MTRARRIRPARTRRATVVLTVAATAAALIGLVGPAATAAPPPPADSLDVVVTSNVTVPATAGAPTLLIERGVAFDVTVTVRDTTGAAMVLSSNKSTTVSLTVGGTAVGTVVIPGGVPSATGRATVTTAGNALQVHAEAKVPPGTKVNNPPLDGDSNRFDVYGNVASVPQSQLGGANVLVSAGGVNAPCEATAQKPTCVDLLLPNGSASAALFATGTCDAAVSCLAPDRGLELVLADFIGTSNTNPATAVFKCDKSLCPGGGIQTYTVQATLAGDGALPPTAAPACASKGVIQAGEDFCVDYVQSKRDGSGDTYLFLLLARDLRGSCC